MNLLCAGCGLPYDRTGSTLDHHGWWHFDAHFGPAPFQGPQAKNPSFTGSMCGPCADTHIFKTQQAFENFVALNNLTKKLST